MTQSSALRKLEELLTEAVETGDTKQFAKTILLEAMTKKGSPADFIDFYALLDKAKEEAKSIKNKPRLDRYLKTLNELCQLFVTEHIWNAGWLTFANYIENKDVLNTLDSLADFFYFQNPRLLLEEDFLKQLTDEFTSLLDEVLKSNLSKDLKQFMTIQLENILKAIRRYYMDGTEGLEKAVKSLISELMIVESNIKNEDKKTPIYRKIKTWGITLFCLFMPTSVYDVIGAVPDIHDFWVPKFEQLVGIHEKVEEITCETLTIQEGFSKTLSVFNEESPKIIAASREQKLLPPATKNDQKDNTNDEIKP